MRGARRDMVDVQLLDEGEEEPPADVPPSEGRRARPRAGTVAFVVTMLVIAGVVVTQLRTSPEPDTGPPVTAPTVVPPVDVVPDLPLIGGVAPVPPPDERTLVIPEEVDGELTRWVRDGLGGQWGVMGGLPVPGVAYVVRVACLSRTGQSVTYGISPNGEQALTSGTVPCDGQEVVSSVGEVPAATPLIATFGVAGRVDDVGMAYVVVVPAP